MYLKLALRNIKRSAKDYVIYFITIILIVMLMYSFLALGFSDDIISMSENMSMLTTGMIVFSVIVLCLKPVSISSLNCIFRLMLSDKNLPAMQEMLNLIPALGRSAGEGYGNPLQYSRLGNLMDRGA